MTVFYSPPSPSRPSFRNPLSRAGLSASPRSYHPRLTVVCSFPGARHALWPGACTTKEGPLIARNPDITSRLLCCRLFTTPCPPPISCLPHGTKSRPRMTLLLTWSQPCRSPAYHRRRSRDHKRAWASHYSRCRATRDYNYNLCASLPHIPCYLSLSFPRFPPFHRKRSKPLSSRIEASVSPQDCVRSRWYLKQKKVLDRCICPLHSRYPPSSHRNGLPRPSSAVSIMNIKQPIPSSFHT
ncbi:hypothetical protein LZ31DRAFT_111536 [Colletotrichum somersetense]|nr:hypothetical protein LZ31DRAFT_111536 [Colletotrichum somersetense]